MEHIGSLINSSFPNSAESLWKPQFYPIALNNKSNFLLLSSYSLCYTRRPPPHLLSDILACCYPEKVKASRNGTVNTPFLFYAPLCFISFPLFRGQKKSLLPCQSHPFLTSKTSHLFSPLFSVSVFIFFSPVFSLSYKQDKKHFYPNEQSSKGCVAP